MVLLCNQSLDGGAAVDALLDEPARAPRPTGAGRPIPTATSRRLDLLPQTAPIAWDDLMHDAGLPARARAPALAADNEKAPRASPRRLCAAATGLEALRLARRLVSNGSLNLRQVLLGLDQHQRTVVGRATGGSRAGRGSAPASPPSPPARPGSSSASEFTHCRPADSATAIERVERQHVGRRRCRARRGRRGRPGSARCARPPARTAPAPAHATDRRRRLARRLRRASARPARAAVTGSSNGEPRARSRRRHRVRC